MRVLLTTLNAKYIHTNLAIRLLYGLNREHEGLEWKEFGIKEDADKIASFCAPFDVVAFSCYIWNITPTLEVARRMKALNPSVKILLGGPEVSYEWEQVIALDHVDHIITGEGEIPFREFLQHYPNVEAVPGLVFKKEGKVHHNPEAAPFDLKELAELMPYRYDDPAQLAGKVLYMETSRGCPYKCEFCLASLDNKVRYLPDASIKATLLFMMQHGRVIKFLDRTFNIKRDFTIGIFKFILEHYRPGNVFQFEITADILHPDIIAFINEQAPAGLFRFEIGIQTVNQKANLEVSRKQNFEKTKKIIQSLSGKVEMHLDLIVGLPLDRWEDIRFSIEEVFKLFAPELQLGFLKFLKGTPLREKYERHGFIFDPAPPYQVIESNYLSREELAALTKLEHALELYWNDKKAVNTLKYVTLHYSIFDFLLGLGTHFSKKKDLHRFTLNDVFEVLSEYAQLHHPQDPYLKELIAVDYYLHFKIRPKNLFLDEVPEIEKNKILEQRQLRREKHRFVVLPVHFDFHVLSGESRFVSGAQNLVIRYNGTEKAEVV